MTAPTPGTPGATPAPLTTTVEVSVDDLIKVFQAGQSGHSQLAPGATALTTSQEDAEQARLAELDRKADRFWALAEWVHDHAFDNTDLANQAVTALEGFLAANPSLGMPARPRPAKDDKGSGRTSPTSSSGSPASGTVGRLVNRIREDAKRGKGPSGS
jgi:hypothetical protein